MRSQRNNAGTLKRRMRGCVSWLGWIAILIIGLLLFGYLYEPWAEARDAKAYPPPGKLVDVGGYRLHIHCTGSGSPTVVIEAGWGDSSAGWGWVQPEVAKTTRVCTYDRAGMGWSESSPEPRTAREFAKELHTLLANVNEPGPYVLVGHSMGGFSILVYAHDYPDEVSGLVLVDSQALPAANATPKPTPKPGGTSLVSLMARIGLVRVLAGPLGAIQDLQPEAKQAYTAYSVIPRSAQTQWDEFVGMSEGGAQAKAVTTLGALPVIVLSAVLDDTADHAASQAGFLQLSTNSQQLFAEQSGHRIMIEQPEAAVAAIVKMVELVHQTVRK
ncbi:MAG TPA: alpha/beta hydrolase [Anaerolineales bacterium]|nr:alpha/beta hydrolase [Anaerolineales bacterium]